MIDVRPRTPHEVFEWDLEAADLDWALHVELCRTCRTAADLGHLCPEGRSLYLVAADALADYLFFVRGEGSVYG